MSMPEQSPILLDTNVVSGLARPQSVCVAPLRQRRRHRRDRRGERGRALDAQPAGYSRLPLDPRAEPLGGGSLSRSTLRAPKQQCSDLHQWRRPTETRGRALRLLAPTGGTRYIDPLSSMQRLRQRNPSCGHMTASTLLRRKQSFRHLTTELRSLARVIKPSGHLPNFQRLGRPATHTQDALPSAHG